MTILKYPVPLFTLLLTVCLLFSGGCQQAAAPATSGTGSADRAEETEAEIAKLPAEPSSEPAPAPVNGEQLREEAATFFAELVKRVPNNADALELKARYHLLVGETEIAKQIWEAALQLDPNYGYAWQGLGNIAMLNAELEQAIDFFKKAIAGNEFNWEATRELSDAYLEVGNVDEAIRLLADMAAKRPDSAATWLLLGQAHLTKQNFESARTAFENCLKESPGLARAEQGLGTALLRLGKRDEAKPLLESQRAQRTTGKNRSEEETFADEKREIAKRYSAAARVYFTADKQALAESALRRALVLDPVCEEARRLLIGYYSKTEKLPQAIAVAAEMCELMPENASYHYTAGVLYQQQGDIASARREFAEVTRLAPRNPMGFEAQARLLIETRQELSQCVELAKTALELSGTAANHELLAQAYAVNGDLENAQHSLQQALDLEPENKNYQAAMQQLRQARTANKLAPDRDASTERRP